MKTIVILKQEASAKLNISYTFLEKMRKAGMLATITVAGKDRILKQSVEAILTDSPFKVEDVIADMSTLPEFIPIKEVCSLFSISLEKADTVFREMWLPKAVSYNRIIRKSDMVAYVLRNTSVGVVAHDEV